MALNTPKQLQFRLDNDLQVDLKNPAGFLLTIFRHPAVAPFKLHQRRTLDRERQVRRVLLALVERIQKLRPYPLVVVQGTRLQAGVVEAYFAVGVSDGQVEIEVEIEVVGVGVEVESGERGVGDAEGDLVGFEDEPEDEDDDAEDDEDGEEELEDEAEDAAAEALQAAATAAATIAAAAWAVVGFCGFGWDWWAVVYRVQHDQK